MKCIICNIREAMKNYNICEECETRINEEYDKEDDKLSHDRTGRIKREIF